MKESELIEQVNKAVKSSVAEILERQSRAQSQTEKPETHQFVPYQKKCINCGEGNNPDYKEPNVYCSTCGNPIGSVPDDFSGDTDSVKPCRNCGGTNAVKWDGWHRADESDE